MSSEFTLDIQLTELGFSSWDFSLCESQSVKETLVPTQNIIEKSVPEAPTSAEGFEEDCTVPGGSAENGFLQDHQYSFPTKHDFTGNTEEAENISQTAVAEDKKILNYKWRLRRGKELTQERNNDEEKNVNDQCSEVRQKASSLRVDFDVSGEESTSEHAEIEWTEGEGEDEEDDDEEEELEGEEEDDDDFSCSETAGSGENVDNHCHLCDITFPSLFLLREHLNMHAGVRPYRCDECAKQFCQLVNYRTHLRSHSEKAFIHCQICLTIFENEEQLQKHLDTNHFENEFYQCDFCKKIFTDLEVCQDHVEKHRQQAKRHLCLKCGSSFRQRSSLLRHLEWHSRGMFSCSDCERMFSSKASLLRHSFSHSGVLPYTCVKCKRHFRLPSLYRNHDCNPEQIQCMACLVFFKSQEDFDKHKKDTGCWGHQGALPSKTDEVRCMECGQVCASVEDLKKHGSTHQRVLKCAECGMGFRSSLMLMSHMGGHAGQRPCLCKDCGLGFPHQQGYDSHLKTCGQVVTPVATAKKPKQRKHPASQIPNSKGTQIILHTLAQDSNLFTLSQNKVAHADLKQPADEVWKLTLNKEPPPGMPLVMFLPVPPSDPTRKVLPSSLVLDTPQTASHVLSMPVVPPSPVIIEETQDIPANILISEDMVSKKRWAIMEDKKVGEETMNVIADVEVGNDKPKPKPLITDENVISSSDASSNLKDSPLNAESECSVPIQIITEKQTPEASETNSEVDKGLLKISGDCVQGDVDVEVEVNEEMVIADEDSGVDMLESELQECITCGQFLPEKEMVQHCMSHAAVSDSSGLSTVECTSHTTAQSPSCSPSRKRQRSGTEML